MISCFQCGKKAIHNHYVVPRMLGGTKTVPLCTKCNILAGRRRKGTSQGLLIKEGIAFARIRGVALGRPKTIDVARVIKLHKKGLSLSAIGEKLSCSKAGIFKVLRRENIK